MTWLAVAAMVPLLLLMVGLLAIGAVFIWELPWQAKVAFLALVAVVSLYVWGSSTLRGAA